MLPNHYFERHDNASPIEHFYKPARLVTHIDDRAIAAVSQLYREYLPPGSHVLDLMSSWVSHFPEEIDYVRVVGLGMNQTELDANLRLHERVVQNLNRVPELPFANGEFDGACICVSVQYLIKPVRVFHEIGRVLRPGAPLVVTFSNRCFPTKAVTIWQSLDDNGHSQLIQRYFEQAGNWTDIQTLDRSPAGWRSDPLYAVVGHSTNRSQPLRR